MKRYRRPKVLDGQIKVQMGKVDSYSDPDMCVFYGDNVPRGDRALVINAIGSETLSWDNKVRPSLMDELEKRGYDLDTLRFSIEPKELKDD